MPKSSTAMVTPMLLNRCMISAARSMPIRVADSVSSIWSRSGASRCAQDVFNLVEEGFTHKLDAGNVDRDPGRLRAVSARRRLKAGRSIMCAPRGMMRPVSSAMGMKFGETTPRVGWVQRASASKRVTGW